MIDIQERDGYDEGYNATGGNSSGADRLEADKMVTYEDITDMFLSAAEATNLSAHPEFWMNSQTLEREFACTLHPGPCEEADQHAACTVSFAWGPLDTVLSIDGAEGICEFFHEPDEDCPHLHTGDVPPLALDLTFTSPFEAMSFNQSEVQSLARTMKLRASEHSGRAVETRPTVSLEFGENGMQVESLTLQQRVELPLWDPEGVSGFRTGLERDRRSGHMTFGRTRRRDERDEYEESDEPHPEDWLPHLFTEVMNDIINVIAALEVSRSAGRTSGDSALDN